MSSSTTNCTLAAGSTPVKLGVHKMKTILLALPLSTAAFGQREQKIEQITDQDTVVLDNGDQYEVLDSATAEQWDENDKVTVDDSAGTLVNENQGDTVDATPVD